MDKKITAWVTKYALTEGVLKVRGEVSSQYPKFFDYGAWNAAKSQEWFRCEQDALDRAATMRVNKIASLEKQLAKMHALKIQVVDQTK